MKIIAVVLFLATCVSAQIINTGSGSGGLSSGTPGYPAETNGTTTAVGDSAFIFADDATYTAGINGDICKAINNALLSANNKTGNINAWGFGPGVHACNSNPFHGYNHPYQLYLSGQYVTSVNWATPSQHGIIYGGGQFSVGVQGGAVLPCGPGPTLPATANYNSGAGTCTVNGTTVNAFPDLTNSQQITLTFTYPHGPFPAGTYYCVVCGGAQGTSEGQGWNNNSIGESILDMTMSAGGVSNVFAFYNQNFDVQNDFRGNLFVDLGVANSAGFFADRAEAATAQAGPARWSMQQWHTNRNLTGNSTSVYDIVYEGSDTYVKFTQGSCASLPSAYIPLSGVNGSHQITSIVVNNNGTSGCTGTPPTATCYGAPTAFGGTPVSGATCTVTVSGGVVTAVVASGAGNTGYPVNNISSGPYFLDRSSSTDITTNTDQDDIWIGGTIAPNVGGNHAEWNTGYVVNLGAQDAVYGGVISGNDNSSNGGSGSGVNLGPADFYTEVLGTSSQNNIIQDQTTGGVTLTSANCPQLSVSMYSQGGLWNCGSGLTVGSLSVGNVPANAILYGGGSLNCGSVNGNRVVTYNITASAPVPPTCNLQGVPVNAQSSNYTLVYSDRGSYFNLTGSSLYSLVFPLVTGNIASNFPIVAQNNGTANIVLAANTSDQFNGVGAGSSLTLTQVTVAGNTTYTGTITNGANNFYAGYNVTTAGFALGGGQNNVSNALVISSTATTIVVATTTQANETHAGTAIIGAGLILQPNQSVFVYSSGTSPGNWQSLTIGSPTSANIVSVPNDTTTGTNVNQIARELANGTANSAITTTTAITKASILGICVANCGTTGNALIAQSGIVPCVFDGATTVNDAVIVSTSVAGDCSDYGTVIGGTGTTPPENGIASIGRVQSTNGGAGTYNVMLFPFLTQKMTNPMTLAGDMIAGGTPTTGVVSAPASRFPCASGLLVGGTPPTCNTTQALGNTPFTFNWSQTTDSQDAFTFGETAAATNGTLTNLLANQAELHVSTASASTAAPLEVEQLGITATTGPPIAQFETTWNNASLVGQGIILNATDTSSATSSLLLNLEVGNATKFKVNKNGSSTQVGYQLSSPQTAQITGADWSCGTTGTVSSCVAAQTIGTLSFTFPLAVLTWTIDCNLIVGQATGTTANNWNVQTATNGATNSTFSYVQNTAAGTIASGVTADQGSTTTTFNIGGAWTQGATGTKMPVHIWGTIEGTAAAGTVFNLQLVAPTVGDLVTIYRGSACRAY